MPKSYPKVAMIPESSSKSATAFTEDFGVGLLALKLEITVLPQDGQPTVERNR